jgi:hypothetical protein
MLTKKPHIMCPTCHTPMTFDYGLPGNFWDLPEPPIWFCACGETQTPTSEEITAMFRSEE